MTAEPEHVQRATVSYGDYLRVVADDPQMSEGDLRAHMRDASLIIDKQTEALNQATALTSVMVRRFSVLSLAMWTLAALFVARALDWI